MRLRPFADRQRIGWHKLTKEEYEAKLAAYQEKQAKKAEAAE